MKPTADGAAAGSSSPGNGSGSDADGGGGGDQPSSVSLGHHHGQQQGSRPPKAMRLHPHPPVMSSPLRQPPITATISPDQHAHQRQPQFGTASTSNHADPFHSPTPAASSGRAQATPAQSARASSSVAEGFAITFSTPSVSQQQHRHSLGGGGILVRPDQHNRSDDRRKSAAPGPQRRVSFAATKHVREFATDKPSVNDAPSPQPAALSSQSASRNSSDESSGGESDEDDDDEDDEDDDDDVSVLSGFLPFTLPNLTSTGAPADSKSAFSEALFSALTSSSLTAAAGAATSATPTRATPSANTDYHGADASEPSSLLSYDAPLTESAESIRTLSSTASSASPYPTTPRTGHAHHHFVHTPGSTVSAMHDTFGESPIHPSSATPGSRSPFVTGTFAYSPHHLATPSASAASAGTTSTAGAASTGHQADDEADEDYFRNLGPPALPSQFLAQAHQADSTTDDLTAVIFAEYGAGIAAAQERQRQQREASAGGAPDDMSGSPAPVSPARRASGSGGAAAGMAAGQASTGLYPDLGEFVAKVVEQGQGQGIGSPDMDRESGAGSFGGSASGSGVEDDGNDLMRYINDFGGEEEEEAEEQQPQPQPQQPEEPEQAREPEQGHQAQQAAAESDAAKPAERQQEQDDMDVDTPDKQPSPQPPSALSPKLAALGLVASQPLPSGSSALSPAAPPAITSYSQPAVASASASANLFASTASSATHANRRGTFGGPSSSGPGSSSSWTSVFGDGNRRSTFGGALGPKAPLSLPQDQEKAQEQTEQDERMDVDPPMDKRADGAAEPDAEPQDDTNDDALKERAQSPGRETSPIVRSSVSPPPAPAVRTAGSHSPAMDSLMLPPTRASAAATKERRESLIKVTDAMLSPVPPARRNPLPTVQEQVRRQEQPAPAASQEAQPRPQPQLQTVQPLMSPATSSTTASRVQQPPQTPTTNPFLFARPMTGSRTVPLPPPRAATATVARISSTPQPRLTTPIAPLRTLQDTLNEIVARKSAMVGTPAAAARLAAISSPAPAPVPTPRPTFAVPSTPATRSTYGVTPRAPMPQSTARVLSADAFGTSSRSELLDLMTPGRAMRRVASADAPMSPAHMGPSVHIGRRPGTPARTPGGTPGHQSAARLMPGRPETPLSGRVNRMLLGSAWEKQSHDMQGTPSKAGRLGAGRASGASSPFTSSPRPMPGSSGSSSMPSGLDGVDQEEHAGDVSDLMQLSMPDLVDADLGDPAGAGVDESSDDPADILKHIIASGSQQFVFKDMDMHDHLLPLPSNEAPDPLATAPKYQLVGRDFQLLQSKHELCNYYMRRILSGAAEAADIEAAITLDAREHGEYPRLWQLWIESRDNPTMRQFLLDKLNYLIAHLNNVTRAEHLMYHEQQLQALLDALNEAWAVFSADADALKQRLDHARSVAARLQDLMEEKRERIRVQMEEREARERAVKEQVADLQKKVAAARAHRLAAVQALNERHAKEQAAKAKVESARARNQELRNRIAQSKGKKDVLAKVPTVAHLEQEIRVYEHLASATGWTVDPASSDKLVLYYRDALKVCVTWPVSVNWNIDEVTTSATSFRSGDVIPQLLANVQTRIMREPKALRVIPGTADVLPSAFNWIMDRWDTWMRLDVQMYALKIKFAGDFRTYLEAHGSELAGGGYAVDNAWVGKIAFFSAAPGAYLLGDEPRADDENAHTGIDRFRVDMYLSVDPWTWNPGEAVKISFKAHWGNAPAQELAGAAKRGGYNFAKIGEEVLNVLKQANTKSLS